MGPRAVGFRRGRLACLPESRTSWLKHWVVPVCVGELQERRLGVLNEQDVTFISVIAGSWSLASGAEDVSHAVQEEWDPRVLQSMAEGGRKNEGIFGKLGLKKARAAHVVWLPSLEMATLNGRGCIEDFLNFWTAIDEIKTLVDELQIANNFIGINWSFLFVYRRRME